MGGCFLFGSPNSDTFLRFGTCSTASLGDVGEDGDKVQPKVWELISDLERSGFINRGGKGSHRNFVHPKVTKPITISGAPGDDAKHYQVRAVRRAIEESKS